MKHEVCIMQENYEYYNCDKNGQPVGDMIDHNYDAPYRYVVREVGEFEDLEEFDTYEDAKAFAERMDKHDSLSIDFNDELNMYSLVKYDAHSDEWNDMHIYARNENDMKELLGLLNK